MVEGVTEEIARRGFSRECRRPSDPALLSKVLRRVLAELRPDIAVQRLRSLMSALLHNRAVAGLAEHRRQGTETAAQTVSTRLGVGCAEREENFRGENAMGVKGKVDEGDDERTCENRNSS